MFFRKKCSCGEVVVHKQSLPTMHGNVTLGWCDDCWKEKQEDEEFRSKINKLKHEERVRRDLEKREEEKRQQRYEYLKREIELLELERKAKELGIE